MATGKCIAAKFYKMDENLSNMNKLLYNYHTHTSRCGHAIGLDEEYVIKAIELGIKRLGFSDHVFFPNLSQPRVRMDEDEVDDYLSSIHHLQEKYKNQIEIKVGFEVEYLPMFIDQYVDLLKTKKVDYLILGQHFGQYDTTIKSYREDIMRYAYDVKAAVELGVFTYIAHPDHFLLGKKEWDNECEQAARIIFETCEKTGTPLEINILGIRYHRPYPSKDFFKLSKEYKLKYVLGIDAHDPNNFNQEDINRAFDFLKEIDIDIIDLKI